MEDKTDDIKTTADKSFDTKKINKKFVYAAILVAILLAIYLAK